MTYEQLEKLRNMTPEEADKAADLAAAAEAVIAEHPFKDRPRSLRFLGAGFGCMEVFCNDGVFTVVRNNGEDLDPILELPDFRHAFIALIKLIYEGRQPESFAEEQYDEIFGE